MNEQSPWINVALYEPEIAPNTGNIMRLCANAGAALHLVGPLGFSLDDRKLRRAGLDYAEWAQVQRHVTLGDLHRALPDSRLLALSTRGTTAHPDIRFMRGDILLFGPETRGLPDAVLDSLPRHHCLRIPMQPGSRSLNLANAVAITVYEAWRQHDFEGCA